MTTTAELDALIEELTVDAYNDEEQLGGFLVGAEEALVRGERAAIAGAAALALSSPAEKSRHPRRARGR
jgi:hypothetical protein